MNHAWFKGESPLSCRIIPRQGTRGHDKGQGDMTRDKGRHEIPVSSGPAHDASINTSRLPRVNKSPYFNRPGWPGWPGFESGLPHVSPP
jgi:hypothetical protein